jgi:hypothetical protein
MTGKNLVGQILLFVLSFPLMVFAGENISAKKYADQNGLLDDKRAAMFFLSTSKETIPYYEVVDPVKGTIDSTRVEKLMEFRLRDLRKWKSRHGQPWHYTEIDSLYPGPTAAGNNINILIRGSISDLNCSPGNAKGASIGLTNNNLIGGHAAWNSSGAVGILKNYGDCRTIPNVSWDIAQTQGAPSRKNTEEVSLSLPVYKDLHMGKQYVSMWVLQAKPYFQTDFSFGYEIYGGEISAEYIGNIFGESSLFLGGFNRIKNVPSLLRYQFRVIPKVDWSTAGKVDIHTAREKDDAWMRMGGLASLDIRLNDGVDVGSSFETLQKLSGNAGCANLFSSYLTFRPTVSSNVGITLKYVKGKTLQAMAQKDMVSLGIDIKY